MEDQEFEAAYATICFTPFCSVIYFEETENEKGQVRPPWKSTNNRENRGGSGHPRPAEAGGGPALSSESGVCKESLCFRKMSFLYLEDPRHTSRRGGFERS